MTIAEIIDKKQQWAKNGVWVIFRCLICQINLIEVKFRYIARLMQRRQVRRLWHSTGQRVWEKHDNSMWSGVWTLFRSVILIRYVSRRTSIVRCASIVVRVASRQGAAHIVVWWISVIPILTSMKICIPALATSASSLNLLVKLPTRSIKLAVRINTAGLHTYSTLLSN